MEFTDFTPESLAGFFFPLFAGGCPAGALLSPAVFGFGGHRGFLTCGFLGWAGSGGVGGWTFVGGVAGVACPPFAGAASCPPVAVEPF